MRGDIAGPIITILLGIYCITVGQGCATTENNERIIIDLRSRLSKTNDILQRLEIRVSNHELDVNSRFEGVENRILVNEEFRKEHGSIWSTPKTRK